MRRPESQPYGVVSSDDFDAFGGAAGGAGGRDFDRGAPEARRQAVGSRSFLGGSNQDP
jgi:hypothetical protein